MWQVLEHRRVTRGLDKVPIEILKRYDKWKDIVQLSGPSGLRLIKDFRDEALRGEWKGHRGSLGYSGEQAQAAICSAV